jgi:hypothetical protein
MNLASVGTFAERMMRFVVFAKMEHVGAVVVVDNFFAVSNQQPTHLKKSMIYSKKRTMHDHKILDKYWYEKLFG